MVSPTASERVLEQSLQIAMDRMKSRARPPLWRHGSEPRVIVRTGNPARLICDTVEQEQSDLLVVGQVALSMVALICAGLFLRSLGNARQIDPGFDLSRLAVLSFDLASRGMPIDAASLHSFSSSSTERRCWPGIDPIGSRTPRPCTANSG